MKIDNLRVEGGHVQLPNGPGCGQFRIALESSGIEIQELHGGHSHNSLTGHTDYFVSQWFKAAEGIPCLVEAGLLEE